MNRPPDDPGVSDDPPEPIDEGRAMSFLGLILALCAFALIAILLIRGWTS